MSDAFDRNTTRSEGSPFHGLLSQARHDSDAALGELLERFRDDLLMTAEMALDSGVRPKIGASDLVQEAMIEAQRDFSAFQGRHEPELRGWLKRILINNLLNQYREWKQSQKRQLSREISLGEINSGQHPLGDPAGISPSGIASRREQADALKQAMARLPEDYRTIIELRHRDQLGFEEIGRSMNRSADAVRMLWYRAFERLTAEMGGRP